MGLLRHKDVNFICCLVVAIAIAMTPLLNSLDNALYDLTPSSETNSAAGIVLIEIDEKSIASLGRWPWPRKVHAQLLKQLSEAQVNKLAYNIAFIDPDIHDLSGDKSLIEAFKLFNQVTLPLFPENGQLLYPFRSLTGIPNATFGHVDIPIDSDGTVRRVYLKAGLDAPSLPAFGLAARQDALSHSPFLPGRISPKPQLGIKHKWIRDYEVLIPALKNNTRYPTYSFIDLLEHRISPTLFKDKVVFVGIEAVGLEAKYMTAQGAISSTLFQASLYDSLKNESLLTPILAIWGLSYALLITSFAYMALFLFKQRKTPLFLTRSGTLLLLTLPTIALHFGYWLPLAPALGGLISCLAIALLQVTQNYSTSQRNDPVTALANRKMLNETLSAEWELSGRKKTPLSMLIIEIDHFKRFVDTFGLERADWVLARISPVLALHKRKHRDLIARYNADQLALLLPITPNNVAQSIAEKIRKDIEALDLEHVGTKNCLRVTASVGLATFKGEIDYSQTEFIEHAVNACREAKTLGGNRVINTLRDAEI